MVPAPPVQSVALLDTQRQRPGIRPAIDSICGSGIGGRSARVTRRGNRNLHLTGDASGMIDQALSAVIARLNTHIGAADPEVVLGNISLIDAYQGGASQTLSDKVIASVVNIEQEEALRNLPFRRGTVDANGMPRGVERAPQIYLNVYVLFGANKNSYLLALQRISQVLGFFQRQFVFTAAEIPALTGLGLSRLVFDLHSMNFEELNQLWGMMGGKYIPSVMYKMRLAVVQEAAEQTTGIISEVDLRSGVLGVEPEAS
jgi:hypothetical protein